MYIDQWDKYEKEKDELTTANIIMDLKQYYRRCIRDLLILIMISPLSYIILKCIISIIFFECKRLFDYSLVEIIETALVSLFFIMILICIIFDVGQIIIGFSLIKKKDFYITTDIVVKKLPRKIGGKFSSSRPYTLEFKQSAPYKILDETNYKWSLLFPSTDKDIYDSTSLNDEFYLINIGKKKSIVGYNKKHCELKE